VNADNSSGGGGCSGGGGGGGGVSSGSSGNEEYRTTEGFFCEGPVPSNWYMGNRKVFCDFWGNTLDFTRCLV